VYGVSGGREGGVKLKVDKMTLLKANIKSFKAIFQEWTKLR